MQLEISADKDLGAVAMRLGPFAKRPRTSDVFVNGKNPIGVSNERSGDSWWMKFKFPIGPAV
jgi:hypothetical protein